MDRHWQTLELPKILERLAAHASFSVGAEKARHLTPSRNLSEVRERLATTAEARRFLAERPQTDLGGVRDLRPLVEAARRSVLLSPSDLLDIRQTLLVARRFRQVFAPLESAYPRLSAIVSRLALCPDLVEAIGRALDDRGEVRDDASPALARVRQELRVTHDRLMDRLQRIIASPENQPFLQEPLITMREGRYVIPLKAEFKGRIPGIVHDRSASGATLFIEPLAVVDLANAWRELQLQEAEEVRRILAELTARVAAHGEELIETVDALADLDLAFAAARYAEELNAAEPVMTDGKPRRDHARLALLQARHPLLDPATVVPIDVVLDGETHVLVITGPNTGGKTVTLKTVGLMALMAQSGLHIPAAPGSSLPVFHAVYADIGDEQSIEQSLSTFSAHLTNILSFLHRADERSLVLLDELGAGTDPAEGSALARALLEAFRRKGAIILVATHYPELKAYAQLTPGVRNACVEFDPETLRPTYHLTIGLPGRSNAFAIARRLGLDEEIVRQAEALISREDRMTESLLADLHRLRLEAARARDEALAARAEARRLEEELRKRLAQIEEERAAILEAARREAQAEVERLREELRALRRKLGQIAAKPLPPQAIPQARETIADVEAELEELSEAAEETLQPPPTPPSGPLRVGETVWVASLRATGQLLAVEDGEAEVQVGALRVRVPVRELEWRPSPTPPPTSSALRARATAVGAGVSPRLDLRGQTVEDALEQLDRHLDAAMLAGLPWVHIVHGKGTGALRQAVRDFLSRHPLVRSFRPGGDGEGGDGVTVAILSEE
ncbi:MAG: endonuclease MutS2 [Anaerolineae bacterium]|nr:endonuclease MutS2 [Anaerolineae bacterium]MCX8068388.1 endonuclease MutS2 [Anaerolineae bacterium]MDW7992717.1 endonuclease MutS2 [Anaerolineae bacterium]